MLPHSINRGAESVLKRHIESANFSVDRASRIAKDVLGAHSTRCLYMCLHSPVSANPSRFGLKLVVGDMRHGQFVELSYDVVERES